MKLRRLLDALLIALVPAAASAADAPPPNAPVELQVGLCTPAEDVVRALTLRPHDVPVDVWFFDDASLSMFSRGVRFRLRITGSKGELTLKVANQQCASIAPDLVPKSAGKCEYDRHGDKIAGAVSLSQKLDGHQIRRLTEGKRALAEELSPPQIRYLRDVLRLWPLPATLRPLGPVDLHRYRSADKRYDLDVWTVPNGGRDVEISRKVPWSEADAAYRMMLQDLELAKVSVCADQSAQSAVRLRALLAPK